ncbi:MAG: M15 family metallopeptidase [Clostridia bacterium]|nr:M15 family metallopeptidase [Clostridia bacterium]
MIRYNQFACWLVLLLVAICLCVTGCGVPLALEGDFLTSSTNVTTTTATTTTATTATTITKTTAVKMTAAAAPLVTLDPAYRRLLLVNAEHPLPEDFEDTDALVSIPSQYCNGSLRQIDKDIFPYVIAMIEAAKKDGVTLYVRSPYRSYTTQQTLFRNKVKRMIADGVPADQAEAAAARAVARPGTSEHQTGLAIDFNTANSKFENTPAHLWLMEHAAEYGFILRYPKDKTEITGIMYEPWHWRFVGVEVAQEIAALGVAFEEYIAAETINTTNG